MVIAFSLQGFGSWGLPLHLISLFHRLGVPAAAAVGIAALHGVMSVARLTLLGPGGCGALMGKLALAQNLLFAAAPFLFAVAFRRLGFVGGVLLALLLSLAALIAVGLALTVRQARRAHD